jgi:hypothetical protein
MTLKTIHHKFAEILQKEVPTQNPIDLSLQGPLMSILHPKLIWAKLLFEENLLDKIPKIHLPNWHYECFQDPHSASLSYPKIQPIFEGIPSGVNRFLNTPQNEAVIDFKDLGTIVLTKNPPPFRDKKYIYDYLLPIWIDYALSPELWGPLGKWTLFHQRLHKLFTELNLLEATDSVGYYPLNLKASKLSSRGFQGTIINNSYLLVLPWCFSLSALNKLEEVIRQEF